MKRTIATLTTLVTLGASTMVFGEDRSTTTQIEHLVIIIGENVSFDAMFGGFTPTEVLLAQSRLTRLRDWGD